MKFLKASVMFLGFMLSQPTLADNLAPFNAGPQQMAYRQQPARGHQAYDIALPVQAARGISADDQFAEDQGLPPIPPQWADGVPAERANRMPASAPVQGVYLPGTDSSQGTARAQ